jgi:Mrp family chromosome partitioning ATPase
MKAQLFLKRYFAALNRYKWIGLATFTCISAIAVGATVLRPEPEKTYAEGVLSYKPATAMAPTTENQTAKQPSMPGIESLMSEQIFTLASKNLAIKQQTIGTEALRDRIILKKDPQQENRVLIQYWDNDAKRAQLIVETITNAVANDNLIAKSKEVEPFLQLLKKRKKLLENNLRVAEEKLRNFSRQEKPSIQAAIDGSLVSSITNIQQQQRQLRSQLEGIDAEIASIQNKLRMTPDQAYLAAALSADTTIGNLKTKMDSLETELEIQGRELQPKHPDMIALQHQKTVYEKQLGYRIGEVVGGDKRTLSVQNVAQFRQLSSLDKARQELANKLVTLQTQRDRLAQEFNILSRSEPELRQTYRDGTELKLELENRTREVARYREAFDQTDKQLAAIELKKAEVRSDWLTDSTPQIKDGSNWLFSRPAILVAGTLLGVLVAGTFVLLIDLLNGTILIPEEVQAILEQRAPFLGVLPSISNNGDENKKPILWETDSPDLEFYQLLRSSLQRHSNGPAPQIVLLSSTTQSEGKTVSAYNLAIASARAKKKTLLIEANLRAPSQMDRLGVCSKQSEEAIPTDFMQLQNIQPVPGFETLFALPSPGAIEQVTEVLESSQTQQLLKQVRDAFDLVVIDTTALQFSDALLIEPFTDGLILVTRPGYTDRKGLKIVIEKLMEFSDIKLLGAIVNDVMSPVN